jgi:hypothetical protein
MVSAKDFGPNSSVFTVILAKAERLWEPHAKTRRAQSSNFVVPAQAGTQSGFWIPATRKKFCYDGGLK